MLDDNDNGQPQGTDGNDGGGQTPTMEAIESIVYAAVAKATERIALEQAAAQANADIDMSRTILMADGTRESIAALVEARKRSRELDASKPGVGAQGGGPPPPAEGVKRIKASDSEAISANIEGIANRTVVVVD